MTCKLPGIHCFSSSFFPPASECQCSCRHYRGQATLWRQVMEVLAGRFERRHVLVLPSGASCSQINNGNVRWKCRLDVSHSDLMAVFSMKVGGLSVYHTIQKEEQGQRYERHHMGPLGLC